MAMEMLSNRGIWIINNTGNNQTGGRKMKAKKLSECPDCGKTLKPTENLYGIYRDRYKSEKHPQGKLYVCKDCYIGK